MLLFTLQCILLQTFLRSTSSIVFHLLNQRLRFYRRINQCKPHRRRHRHRSRPRLRSLYGVYGNLRSPSDAAWNKLAYFAGSVLFKSTLYCVAYVQFTRLLVRRRLHRFKRRCYTLVSTVLHPWHGKSVRKLKSDWDFVCFTWAYAIRDWLINIAAVCIPISAEDVQFTPTRMPTPTPGSPPPQTTPFPLVKRIIKQGQQFDGACIDTGATSTVIGIKQARHYCEQLNITFQLTRSKKRFRFGNGLQVSMGTLDVRLPTPNQTMISIKADVVNVDVPLLLGLNFMFEYQAVVDTDPRRPTFSSKSGYWAIDLVHKYGHLYWEWSSDEILFTAQELEKLHLQFYHPSAQKLYNLIKKARPEHATPETRQVLEEIAKGCATCNAFQAKGLRFRVTMPQEDLSFNQVLAMDIFSIHGRNVLHIVDIATGYGNSAFVTSSTAEAFWNTFMMLWVTTYIGFPEKLRLDAGSYFTSKRFQQISEDVGIELQFSGVEHHSGIGLCERYHDPLRRIYRKIHHEQPDLDPELILRLAQKAMNDTVGPNGNVPSYLVFGALPRLSTQHMSFPDHEQRMRAIAAGKREMETVTAELRIREALSRRLTPLAKWAFLPGDKVRTYDEATKRWGGPFTIIKVEGKELVIDRDGKSQHVSISRVAPEKFFHAPVAFPQPTAVLYHQIQRYVRRSTHRPHLNHHGSTFAPCAGSIHITEYLKPWDNRRNDRSFQAAKKKELDGLFRRQTWKLVLQDEVPDNANVLNGRFVLAIKDIETDDPIYKARFVVQGHKDRDKDFLIHDSNNLQQSSIKLIVAVAAVFGFDLWSHDVSQAYLQSATNLLRDVYIKPNKELELPPNTLLKLLKPLYGLADAGDYWHVTFADHLKTDIGMKTVVSDLALFYKHINGQLKGMAGTYVDDSILAGTPDFMKETDKTLKRFDSRDRELHNFTFAGIQIETLDNGSFILHQRSQADRLQALPPNCTYKQFKSRVMQLAWITHTRPDIACVVAQAAQVTQDKMNSAAVKDVNRAIRLVMNTPHKGLRYQKLDLESLRVQVYTDSSFANNHDNSSQLGYIVVLADNTGQCNVLAYRSSKSRRVTRSVLGAEIYAFADGFDRAYAIRRDLEQMLNKNIPLQMFTDSKSLFDIMVRNSTTTEKRLMIDLDSARQSYQSHEIDDIGLLASQDKTRISGFSEITFFFRQEKTFFKHRFITMNNFY